MDESTVNTEAAAESQGAGAASSEGDKEFARGLFGDDFEPEGEAAESGDSEEEKGEEEEKPAEPKGEEPGKAEEKPAESSEAEKEPPERVNFVEHGKTYSVDKAALEAVAKDAGRTAEEFIELYQKGCGFDALSAKYSEAVKDGEIITNIAKARGIAPEEARRELIYAAETLPIDKLTEEILERNPDLSDSEARRWAQAEHEARKAKEREAEEEKKKAAENSEEAKAEKEREAKVREIEAFEKAHPEIKADEALPESVIEAFRNGKSLEDAWSAYQSEMKIAELKAENEKLKAEAAKAEKRKYNEEHSAGSAASSAGASGSDAFVSGLFG